MGKTVTAATATETGSVRNYHRYGLKRPYETPAHIRLIDGVIAEAFRGQLAGAGQQLFVIQTPPRHGKTEYISHWLPAWVICRWPSKNVILTMHTQRIAAKLARRVRRSARQISAQMFDRPLSFSRAASTEWIIEPYGGGMLAAGVGGDITGEGADLLIVDDPIKNSEQAMSPTYREKIWEWWQSTADIRLSPNGIAVVMHTPWHRDDLGCTLKRRSEEGEGTPARVIQLPALAIENDMMGRQVGEALWPEEWPVERLLERKRGRTTYWWQSLFQTNPTTHERAAWPEEYWNDLFVEDDQWPESFEWAVVAVDPSKGKLKTRKGDFTGAVFLGLSGGKLWVDAHIERIPLARIVPEVLTFSLSNGCDDIGFESDQFQELLTFEWARVRQDVGLPPKPAHLMATGGVNKETRIERLGPYFDQRIFRFKRNKGTERLLAQLREFPLADHDDGPDAMEQATRLIERVATLAYTD